MVATKIYKKCSPNGRLYLYLGQREYISSDGDIDSIKGIAYMPELGELQGTLVFTPRLNLLCKTFQFIRKVHLCQPHRLIPTWSRGGRDHGYFFQEGVGGGSRASPPSWKRRRQDQTSSNIS